MERETAAYEHELVRRLGGLLGDRLAGAHLSGSIALGDYVHGRSDLDLVGVCRATPTPEERAAIVASVRHEALPCPARGLELVLYTERALREDPAGARFELNLNTGRKMPFRASSDPVEEPAHWFVLDRAIVRDHGVTLAGAPPQTLFAPVPRAVILDALTASLRWHRDDGEARPDDAILNACRALRFAAENRWSSKDAAGRWALARGEDQAAIEAAIARRHDPEAAEPAPERVESFLAGALRALDATRGASRGGGR